MPRPAPYRTSSVCCRYCVRFSPRRRRRISYRPKRTHIRDTLPVVLRRAYVVLGRFGAFRTTDGVDDCVRDLLHQFTRLTQRVLNRFHEISFFTKSTFE